MSTQELTEISNLLMRQAGRYSQLCCIVSLDFCEKNPSSSKVVNTYFPQMLALWCNSKGTKLIHISTDHLYYQMQGDGNLLHVEEDPCSVANRYAGQKLLAEEMVKSIDNKALIRTNLIGW